MTIEEINKKNEFIDNIIVRLKSEFIGIDDQIDQIMNHVRTWYLYPNLQSSPIVVCLWGLTGTGKTSLLKRIAKYLDIEEDLVYFNFAEINEMTSYDVESNIEEQLSNEKSNRMFVYDEFQYAATLDAHGEEKDNKNGLKPFWELLDTGIIHKRSDYWNVRTISKVLTYIVRINSVEPMDIRDGKWVNSEECLCNFTDWDRAQFATVFNFADDGRKHRAVGGKGKNLKMASCAMMDEPDMGGCESDGVYENHFLKDEVIERIMDYSERCYKEKVDRFEIYHGLFDKNIDDIMDMLSDLVKKISRGYDLTFNDSIIFIVGNLDEAYDVAFDVNPDMSPDQFNKITKKINLVDIKKALQRRFRNEQIARMGNSHVMYPSFSSKDFKNIISYYLDEYRAKVKEISGYNIVYDDSLHNIIYKEAVFPTHGTRPIFSTIQEIVKTKLPNVIRGLHKNGIMDENIDRLKYSFKRGNVVVEALDKDGVVLKRLSFKERLKIDSLRKSTKDENQAMCALHESGHFVCYAKLFGEMPEKLVSKTTDSMTNGFLLENVDDDEVESRENFEKRIMVMLGGYVAEKMFFGVDKMSCGASSDLKSATMTASKMVRCFGMGKECVFTTYLTDPSNGGHVMNEDNQEYINEQIKAILRECTEKVEQIFNTKEWRKMLQASALYLSENSNMPKSKMRELYDAVDDSCKVKIDKNYYRDKIKKML